MHDKNSQFILLKIPPHLVSLLGKIHALSKEVLSSHSIFFVQKRNCGTSELLYAEVELWNFKSKLLCGSRTAELQVVVYFLCGSGISKPQYIHFVELRNFKSHTILCVEAELRNFKSKYIVQKRNYRNSSRRIFFLRKRNLSWAARDLRFTHTWHSHCNSLGMIVKAVSRVIPQHWKWQSVG